MKMRKVKFGKKLHKYDGHPSVTPKSVTVTLSLAEATFIAKVIGKQNHTDGERVFTGGGGLGEEIYSCLTGEFFNHFFFAGVDDAVREVSK